MSFISASAQKFSHDIDAFNAFERSDVPAGVDYNLFADAKRVIVDRIAMRAKRAQATGDLDLLCKGALRASNERAEAFVSKAQHRRAMRAERDLMLAELAG